MAVILHNFDGQAISLIHNIINIQMSPCTDKSVAELSALPQSYMLRTCNEGEHMSSWTRFHPNLTLILKVRGGFVICPTFIIPPRCCRPFNRWADESPHSCSPHRKHALHADSCSMNKTWAVIMLTNIHYTLYT